MKKITFLFMLSFVMLSYSQTQLRSSLHQYDNNGTWENSNGYNYEYDSNNNLTSETNFYWVGSLWAPQFKDIYTYSATNKVLMETSQDYNDLTQQFETDYVGTYTYNTNDNLTEILFKEMINGTLVNEYKASLTYNGTTVASLIETEWIASQWVMTYRSTITYNGNGTIAKIDDDIYVNGDWELDTRVLFSYDANNKISQINYETWDGSSWEVEETISYTLDANGNRTSETDTYDSNSIITTYTYDMSALMSNFANPFRDKTGVDYFTEDQPFVNKILESNSSDNRTIYNYTSTLSIDDAIISAKNSVSVYPNPSNSIVNIDSKVSIDTIEFYDLLGKKVLTSQSSQTDISGLMDGVYTLKIITINGGVDTKKLIKQ